MFQSDGLFWGYAIAVIIVAIIGWIIAAGSFAGGSDAWHHTISKPRGMPGKWGLATIWVITFLLLISAGYLVDKEAQASNRTSSEVNLLRALFGFQLLFLLLWFVFFYGFHNMAASIIIAIIMFIILLVMYWYYAQISTTAAWMLFPYFLWVIGLIMLSGSIMRKNAGSQHITMAYF